MAYCIGNKLLYELCPQTCVEILTLHVRNMISPHSHMKEILK